MPSQNGKKIAEEIQKKFRTAGNCPTIPLKAYLIHPSEQIALDTKTEIRRS
jgi:hypothetical protein